MRRTARVSRLPAVLFCLIVCACSDDPVHSAGLDERRADASIKERDASARDSATSAPRVDAARLPDAEADPSSSRDGGPSRPFDAEVFDGGGRRRFDAALSFDAGFSTSDSGLRDFDGGVKPGLLRIPVAIHLRDTLLSDGQLLERLAEVQRIWAPADICFEMHLDDSGPDDAGAPFDTGSFSKIDVWLVQIIPRFPMANGLYDGLTGAYVRDEPALQPAPHPVTFPFARTFSHELGHVLGLEHYVDGEDVPDSLMSSKYMGYALHAFEIAEARRVANVLALHDRTPTSCGPPRRGQVHRFVRGLPPWFPIIPSGSE